MLKLLALFIFQNISNDPFNSGFIYFLTILRINEELNRLQTTNNFSFILAGVVYYIRVLAVK